MLYFDRVYVSEGINVNKTNESKEWNFCHYYYFLKALNFNQMSAKDAIIH